MWVFYLISLPLTLGMVIFTLRYFVGPDVPRYVLFTVEYAWFCSLSIIILVVVPLIQGFEDAGDFSVTERLKTSVRVNLVFYSVVCSIGLVGLILLILMNRNCVGILGLAMALSNTFGLVIGAFLLGFGFSEVPKTLWRNADWTIWQKVLSHKIAKMTVKLDETYQELSNAIVVAQATSNQMSKRDPLRPYIDVIDNMLAQMFREDLSFKPQGGLLGENDMDYDSDEKSMATLRRHLRLAREEYYWYKSEYMTYVIEALQLEDTVKNYERRNSTGWKYVSSFTSGRFGKMGMLLDKMEFIWLCILRKQLRKVLAIVLGIMSATILLAEATLLHLSIFSILIYSVKKQEVLVQVFCFIPLMYICIYTYYSLFKIGMLMFYSLTPWRTSSVSLLMICSMVARYAPPISYNFLNLINCGGKKTIFEKDSTIFIPLIMVVYTLLVASNFFDRVVGFFGNWKRLRFQTEADDMDGFDSSGLIILQKERSWLEQGCKVGEQVIPLARNFNGADIESGYDKRISLFHLKPIDCTVVEMKATTSATNGVKGSPLRPSKEETHKYGTSREAIRQYTVMIKEQGQHVSNQKTVQNNIITESHSANIEAKRFLPLRQNQEVKLIVLHLSSSNSESLDEIFQRLKRPSVDHSDEDENENGAEMKVTVSTR
ncbi:hypothetical protein E1A91_D12G085400v1 [Gossypium mustelinum]|uniref:LMBR1-like membrane protein n=1 Tax=Gossypium mustelinum TaxID=34275 RepID=A0A5D2SBF5_GOSMU|nr:hypothetical protein E1A91_D12G085400v1 [Gossypium mustelinum]